jgi:hypothetical protein
MSLNRGPSRKLSASDGAGKHGSNRHIHNHCNTLNSTARRSRHTSHDGGHGPNVRRGPNRHGRRERSDRPYGLPCGRPCDPYGRPCHLRNFSLRRSRLSTRRKALPLAPSRHFSFSSSDVLSLLDGGARRSPQVRARARLHGRNTKGAGLRLLYILDNWPPADGALLRGRKKREVRVAVRIVVPAH